MDDDAFTQALEDLCQDVSFHEAMGRLYVMSKVDAGLKDVAEGRVVEQADAWERLRSWVGAEGTP